MIGVGGSGTNYIPNGLGFLSTSNTSTVASTNFTGSFEQNSYPSVGVSFQADTTGTLYFDFSNDGTNVNTFPVSGFDISSGIHEFHIAVKLGRYFRVRFVGDSAPTYLRLYTYYGDFNQPNAPLNQPLGLDADSVLVRSAPSWLDISRGLFSGVEVIEKFGRNLSVGTSYEPISLGGVYPTPQSGSATTLRVKAGGNANDTAAGTGAREITLEGLDENFNKVTETLATAGASASSATTATFTRLYRAYVSASGTYASVTAGSHAGDIVIEDSGGTQDWLTIDATDFPKGQSEVAAFSVPANYTGYVFLNDVSVEGSRTIDVVFFHRANADETAAPYSAMRAKSTKIGLVQGSSNYAIKNEPLGPFVGPCDIGFMARVQSGSPAVVSTEFEIYLVNET